MFLSIVISLLISAFLLIFLYVYFNQFKQNQQHKRDLSFQELKNQHVEHHPVHHYSKSLTQQLDQPPVNDMVKLSDNIIHASNISSLNISFEKDALYQLKQQFNLTNMQFDLLMNEATQFNHSLNVDWGRVKSNDEQEHIRFVPIHLDIAGSRLTFAKTYTFGFYLRNTDIYAYHIYDAWATLDTPLMQAYEIYIEKISELINLGWKNYYYPHEARYAVTSAARLLEEEQRSIAPQFISYKLFCQCLEGEEQAIHLCLYLEGIVMEILFTHHYSAMIEISKTDHLPFYKKHYLARNDEIQQIADGDIYGEGFKVYKEKASVLRRLAEHAAVHQGHEIDEEYIDPF